MQLFLSFQPVRELIVLTDAGQQHDAHVQLALDAAKLLRPEYSLKRPARTSSAASMLPRYIWCAGRMTSHRIRCASTHSLARLYWSWDSGAAQRSGLRLTTSPAS